MIINIAHYIRLRSDSKFFYIRELSWRPHAVDIQSYDQYINTYLHEYHTSLCNSQLRECRVMR